MHSNNACQISLEHPMILAKYDSSSSVKYRSTTSSPQNDSDLLAESLNFDKSKTGLRGELK